MDLLCLENSLFEVLTIIIDFTENLHTRYLWVVTNFSSVLKYIMTLKLVAINLLDESFSEKIDALTYPNFHLWKWWMCVKKKKKICFRVYVVTVIPACDACNSNILRSYNLAKKIETRWADNHLYDVSLLTLLQLYQCCMNFGIAFLQPIATALKEGDWQWKLFVYCFNERMLFFLRERLFCEQL